MGKLPSIRPEELERVLRKAGFQFERYGSGNCRIYAKPGHPYKIPIHYHPRDIRTGTLRHIISDAGLTVQDFVRLLHER